MSDIDVVIDDLTNSVVHQATSQAFLTRIVPSSGGALFQGEGPMAVVADLDGLDLWVEPHEWTEEEREEVRQFIQADRDRGTDSQIVEKVAELLSRIQTSGASVSSPCETYRERADGSASVKG
jgi:hypothetical protein